MKKFFYVLLLLMLGGQVVSAQGEGLIYYEDLYYKIIDSEAKTVRLIGLPEGITSNIETLNIPPQICDYASASGGGSLQYYKVVQIGDPDNAETPGYQLFSNNQTLRTLTVGYNVTYIAPSAFSYCNQLESVTLGRSVQTLGDDVFSYCTSLRSVTFESSTISSIGERAFAYCSELEALELPEGLTQIPADMCTGCYGMQKLVIPSTVTEIGYGAFNDISSNTALELYMFTDEVPDAFEDNFRWANIKKLHILYPLWASGELEEKWPGKCELLLRNDEFMGARNDTKVCDKNYIYRHTSEQGKCVFVGYASRYDAEPDENISVPDWTAEKEEGSESATPHTVVGIAPKAFYGCDLLSVTLVEKIANIGEEAFANARVGTLRYVVNQWEAVAGKPMPAVAIDAFNSFMVDKVVVPEDMVKRFKETSPWNRFDYLITSFDDGVTVYNGNIGYMARKDFISLSVDVVSVKNLESIEIPATITHTDGTILDVKGLKGNVFNGAESLKTLKIAGAAYELDYDSEVVIPSTVETLEINRNLIGTSSIMPGAVGRSVSSLQTLRIGKNVTSLTHSITDMPAGVSIISDAVKAPAVSAALSQNVSSLSLTVPAGSIPAYRKAANWSDVLNITDTDGTVLSLHVVMPNGHLEFPQTVLGEGKVKIVADEGYQVSTATLHNGEKETELTSDADGYYIIPPLVNHSRLNVVFAQLTPTSLSSAEVAARIKVFASKGCIRVEGAADGEAVTLYDLDGRMLLQTREHEIQTSHTGVLILTVGGETFKFAM